MDFDPVSYMMGQKAAGGGGGGSSSLSGLTDVDISNPTDGQTLVYNATSGKWENGTGGGGFSLVRPNIHITMTDMETGTAICDMTYAAIKSAIENGAICIARITGGQLPEGCYQFTTDVVVLDTEEEHAVAFTAYTAEGGGDVIWTIIIVSSTEVFCYFPHTYSYPQNNP